MSDPNRGARSSERPLKFDGYAPRQRGGPAPVTLVLSLMLLIAVGGGVFYLYNGGVRAPNGPPEPVGTPVGDVRVNAPPQAQTPDPAAGLSIYKANADAPPAPPVFAPPPEQPTSRPGAAPQASAPTAPVVALPGTPGVPATAAATAVATAAAKPAPAHAGAPTIDTLLADSATRTTSPAAATPSAHATPHEASPKPTAGAYVVQIGAFSSPALAEKSWNAAMGLAPGGMAGKGKRVAALTRADGTRLYRTAITGFSTREQAQALCAKLSAAGKSCFVR